MCVYDSRSKRNMKTSKDETTITISQVTNEFV